MRFLPIRARTLFFAKSLICVSISLASASTPHSDGPLFLNPSFQVGNNPFQVIALDLNGDTIQDLAITNPSSRDVSILLGRGDGSFEKQSRYRAGDLPNSIAAGDFNGDHHPELVTANMFSD